jgi:bacterial/archaeal transporter family protein
MIRDLLFGGGWLRPSLLALFFWGWWGFLTKVGAEKTHWQMMMIYFGLSTVILALLPGIPRFKMDGSQWMGLAAGITGAIGFFYFFIALNRGPATTVIPMTSQYVAISSLLAIVFLAEPLTIKKMLGILCALAAVVFLSI